MFVLPGLHCHSVKIFLLLLIVIDCYSGSFFSSFSFSFSTGKTDNLMSAPFASGYPVCLISLKGAAIGMAFGYTLVSASKALA